MLSERGYSPSNPPPAVGTEWKIGGRLIRGFCENVAISAPVDYHPDYLNTYVQAIKDGFVPVFVANHTAQFDAILMSYLAREAVGLANDFLSEDMQIRGAAMPFAKSMENGKQGFISGFMYGSLKSTLERNGIVPIYTTTKNDEKKRNVPKNSREYIAKMIAAMKQGYTAITIFPEGTVEGGKIGEDGKRQGMRTFVEGSCASTIILTEHMDKQGVLFIPIGIEGSWNVNNPDNRLKIPTLQAFLRGINSLYSEPVCHITVGKPIRSDSLEIQELMEDYKRIDDKIGHAVSELLPEELRGVYS